MTSNLILDFAGIQIRDWKTQLIIIPDQITMVNRECLEHVNVQVLTNIGVF